MVLTYYTRQHAADLLEIYSHSVRFSSFTFDIEPPALAVFHQKLKNSHVCLVGVVEGKVIGFAYASTHRPKAAYNTVCEASIYMSTNSQGAGYGSTLYRALLVVLQKLGYYTVLGGITEPNPPSEALHSKLGFVKGIRYEKIGFKDGAWRDVNWWRKDLRTFEGDPERVMSLSDFKEEELKGFLS